ncbi:Kin of IRRE-like protein 3 [Holothuria leucospilota]|uniref:Kin of IRRE-like protein 3 n=1 Tax=Holothuria leucospilota TaxID=206669 RepID=A0A9Q1BYK7_HOLLE|nr:Kin of IRRE-like protein 3 [Holothuria leucospilota]
MEWLQILVISLFSFPIAVTVIIEGPKSAVYPEGTNITLQCIVSDVRNIIVWEDIQENIVIFIDKGRNTQRTKYENFFISDADENFSLTIVNAQLSDDGLYSCQEGDESKNANVTIEAWPELSVFVNDTLLVPENGITLTEDEEVVVMCKADRAKPAVHLTLKFGENEWIEAENIANSKDGLRFTTEATVTHYVSRDDTTVTCKATGLISIPPSSVKISINILHKPVCHVEVKQNIAECQCVSNPPVSTYKWYVDGKLQETELVLPFHDYIPANLMCLATNAVGTGASASRYVSLTNADGASSTFFVIIVIAAVIACGIIVCSVIFFCLYKRWKEKPKFYDAECDKLELGGGQCSVKPDDDGKDKDFQGDNSKPGEKEPSEYSEDGQPYFEASSELNIQDEKKKNTLEHHRENVNDVKKSNSVDRNGEKEPLLSKDKESNDGEYFYLNQMFEKGWGTFFNEGQI